MIGEAAELGEGLWGAPRERLEEVDSTNRQLRELLEEGAPLGTILVAESQTAGRGTRGRGWNSPPLGGLYMSMLLPMPPTPTQLSLVVGLGVAWACRAYAPATKLKWVNDVVLGGRKLGGILVEAVPPTAGAPDPYGWGMGWAVVGVGVNLHDPDEEGAAWLSEAVAEAPSLEELADAVAFGVAEALDTLSEHGWPTVAAAWESTSATIGQVVRVSPEEGDAGEVVEGRALRLGPAGELVLGLADGSEKTVMGGQVRRTNGHYV